jgi:putative transposase
MIYGGGNMLDLNDRESIREYLKQNNIKSVMQVDGVIKKMMGVIIEEMLEIERDDYLGYPKHGRKKEAENSGGSSNGSSNGNLRNGYSPKTVGSSQGDIKLDIPRDRDGKFEPEFIKKHQNDISQIEDKVISMYARGMTVRDIQSHLEEIYGAEISPQTISNMTDRIMPAVEEWRSRALKEIYAIVYIDGQRFKVRSDGTVKEKTVYTVLGIDIEGNKEILGLWIADTESAKYWLSVLTEIKNRGVKDILILTSDDLPGIEDAVKAAYPESVYQGCVVHLMRNSLKYVSHKDRKEFSSDMKFIYKAPTEESALKSLDDFESKWSKEYPLAVGVWDRNWGRISSMYRFTDEIRKLIYTTNAIESVHSQFRKVTRSKNQFPDDNSVFKMLYLSSIEISKKWTMSIPHWNRILAQLSIHFGDRVSKYL